MSEGADQRLAAEQRARVLIDEQLRAAGWSVQDRRSMNLFAAQGVAVRESIMAAGHGRADYLLYVDKRAVGVIEAKPIGTPLSGVEWQSAMYASGLPAQVRLKATTTDGRLPFVFEASGSETHLTNGYDPQPRARRIFAFPRPESLARTLREADRDPHGRRGARRSPSCLTWRPSRCGRRRSTPSAARSAAWPSSISTAASSRWPPEPARRTPR